MPRYRIRDPGRASRRTLIHLLGSLTPLSVMEVVAVVDEGRAFFVDPAVAIEQVLDEFSREHGIEFEGPSGGEQPVYPGPSLAELERWTADGFAPRVVVRYVGGPKKILAIKLLRSRLHLGLRLAKDLIERGQPIAHGLELDGAREWHAAFAELEGRVRFELAPGETLRPSRREWSPVREPAFEPCRQRMAMAGRKPTLLTRLLGSSPWRPSGGASRP